MAVRNRIAVMHGVNFSVLGRRPAQHYGELTLAQLEHQIEEYAHELGLHTRFFQSNHEGAFVEELHRTSDFADAVILNPGAWTHYSWAIRDALEACGLPAVEVHLSDINAREEFRKISVIRDLCSMSLAGKGLEGYRIALEHLQNRLK